MGKDRTSAWLKASRVESFSDAVLAIIITILVLQIDVPEKHDFTRNGLGSFLVEIQHDVVVYLLSFLLIGTYWLMHHVMFHYIARVTRVFIALNGVFLFLISLSPFTTKAAGVYRDVRPVEALFGLNYFLSGVVFFLMWRYLRLHPHLLQHPIDARVRRSMGRRILIAPVLSLVGMAGFLIDFHVGAPVFFAVPLLYLSHWIVDSSWHTDA